MNWYKKAQLGKTPQEEERYRELKILENELESQFPGLDLSMWFYQHGPYIEVAAIKMPTEMQNQGIGHKVMQAIKNKAQEWGIPVVLSPEPAPRKKKKLMNFYKDLGFVPNKGRNKDYRLSIPFAPTMYWRPN